MVVRGEVVLAIVALALSIIAIASLFTGRLVRWRTRLGTVACALAGITPLLSFPFIDQQLMQGRALWEWSAVGGPTVQATYRLDGLAAVGLAIGALYCGAALIATTRVASRSSVLRPALLLNSFVLMTAVVTDDLVAVTAVLGALAANTIFVALLVAPAPAVARVTAYLAGGVQAFIVAALLVTRFGGASFRFDAISPASMSPGVVLAATIGAALFAGLYPFVPWGYRAEESGERESLRGLLTMPAGIAATIVLVRIVGVTRIDLARLALPGDVPSALVVVVAALLVLSLFRLRRRRVGARRQTAFLVLLLGLFVGYPWVHWSHVVVLACVLTVAYAAAVSLALPDQWPVTRYDVTLAAAWIGIATGTPGGLAGAFAVLVGGAFAALADAFWMPPHRAYIVMLASTTTIVAGALGIGIAALAVPDAATLALSIAAVGAVIALELAHVGRRLQDAEAPTELEITATVVAFLTAMLVAIAFAVPALDALARAFGRPLQEDLATVAYAVAALAIVAAILSVVAGAIRPLLPEQINISERIARVVELADPVPLALAAFRILERSATLVSSTFSLFEQRAGVWLAVILIAGVLVWSVR
ncbi:MAG: hypothetical protein E6I57_13395 [Chloroflexi bacterium]|nr:MAG: hypothetical protein E6J49_12985 [Chloroflexota bacterium]TMC26397.1 MAG: hypothetical protein E6J27_12935 [Chloroflexota bacterium]TMC34623.1 MAG: hypothetical protein E6J24_05600 [Chloroflexota bacterium]TMC58575.1 MAG: hypothetical protein E6J19_02625 [Chloroflexota bacterium]TME36701.1 MAG: hypothetical protein E6I57_13395 [Chloroflexota bacterium]